MRFILLSVLIPLLFAGLNSPAHAASDSSNEPTRAAETPATAPSASDSAVLPARTAGVPLNLMRRWVVFPYDVADNNLRTAADNAWWKSRERITATKKYLVASRQFLIQKDVFQPRKNLKPEDVKLLASMLDADVIVTGFSEQREFTLNVYLAQNGSLFWSKHISFHPSLRASDQLELISDNLTRELLAVIPYQGFTVTDPLIGKPVYEEGDKQFAIVDLGNTSDLAPGTAIQWVNIHIPSKPEGENDLAESKISVIGEGVITKVKTGIVVAQVQKVDGTAPIDEKTLVRLPQIAEKNSEPYTTTEGVAQEQLAPELVPTVVTPVVPQSQGGHRKGLLFGSIFGIVGILLLAF